MPILRVTARGLASGLAYLLRCLECDGIEPRAAMGEMLGHHGAHARVPEFADVIRCARDRLVGRLNLEEVRDLVRHADQRIHR